MSSFVGKRFVIFIRWVKGLIDGVDFQRGPEFEKREFVTLGE